MLTGKQEAFCLAFVEFGDASKAYRQAYPGTKMSAKTINEAASRLASDSKVLSRIKELRAPVVTAIQITLQNHLEMLAEIRDRAIKLGQMNAAANAEIARGKASGLYISKVELSANIITPASILAEVEKRRIKLQSQTPTAITQLAEVELKALPMPVKAFSHEEIEYP